MSDMSLTEKLALTVIVLIFSPFVEIVTGAAPIGTALAIGTLWNIWGGDGGPVPEEVAEASPEAIEEGGS
jgi:hypothetical protein